jgi:hypothetical protein
MSVGCLTCSVRIALVDLGPVLICGGIGAYIGGPMYGAHWAAAKNLPMRQHPRYIAAGALSFALAAGLGAGIGEATRPRSAATRPSPVPAVVRSIGPEAFPMRGVPRAQLQVGK